MTKWILERETEDNRYTYCLQKLYEQLDKKLDYEIIERPSLEEVQEFDYFYDDYKSEITKVLSTMQPDDRLLLNTSSGTPAMKSALVVLATVGDIDGSLVQVTTPVKTINYHGHKDYDVKSLWEQDLDNNEDFISRCDIIECPSLYQLKNEELVKNLIRKYDYYAALEVVKTLPEKYTYSYKYLIEYAYHRISLNKEKMSDWELELKDLSFVPSMDDESRELVEYALCLFNKAHTGRYADFVRSMTPLLVSLMVVVLQNITGLCPYDYCYKDKIGGLRWSKEKLEADKEASKWIRIWDSGYSNEFKMGYINSDSLSKLIEEFGNDGVAHTSRSLRSVEKKIRNVAAHQLVAISNESIKIATGNTSGEIIRKIKQLFKYSGIHLPDNVWNSYEEMNDYIIEQIQNSSARVSHDA